jgi:hypothetical protein
MNINIPEQLLADYCDGIVCLFVGAGVSKGCGLPDWKELAGEVVRTLPRKPGPPLGSISAAIARGQRPPPDPNALTTEKKDVLAQEDPLLSMRYARSAGDIDVCSLVRRCLYARSIELSKTVLEIPLLDKVKRICCFNYDDVLDRAFAKKGRTYLPLFQSDRIPLEAMQAIIFYPHGFLPDPNRSSYPATSAIVLAEDDYFELYRSPHAWANMLQLILLLNYTAVFIGCSLLDPNVRRLLDIAARMRPNHHHYAFFLDRYYRKDADWYQSNYATAFRLVQEGILKGLGVRSIWVQEFDDIAAVLEKLRA